MIVAALISLAQIQSARSGRPSTPVIVLGTALGAVQTAISYVSGGITHAASAVASVPRLSAENAALALQNRDLSEQNARLREAISRLPDANAIAAVAAQSPSGVVARTIGYDPESETRIATVDRGSQAGITLDAGVINEDGAVGRVVETTPLLSRVLLIDDPSSKIPALVQRGRWWGIVQGTGSQVEMRYIAQDAPLHAGDLVITSEGHSFHAGVPLGRVRAVTRPQGGLYQTAILDAAVQFGRLGPVVVLAR